MMPAERVSSAVSVLPNPSPQPPDLGNQLLACHRLEILVHNTFSLNRAVSGWRCLFLAELARLPARFRAYQPVRVNLTQSWRQFLESVRWLWTPPTIQHVACGQSLIIVNIVAEKFRVRMDNTRITLSETLSGSCHAASSLSTDAVREAPRRRSWRIDRLCRISARGTPKVGTSTSGYKSSGDTAAAEPLDGAACS